MSSSDDSASVLALIDGFRTSAIVYVAAKLGIADALAETPRTVEALAEALALDASSLARLIRGLIVVGLVARSDDATLTVTSHGRQLCGHDGLRGRAILTGEEYTAAWTNLLHSARTGEVAFNQVFGMSNWEHRQRDPELDRCFNEEMARLARGVAPWVASAYDFSRFQTITDIGGGNGALLAEILARYPASKGILFDQPHVLAAATTRRSDYCRSVGGNFFHEVPPGGDLYILKHVLHDWDDRRCQLILCNTRKAMVPSGRLLIVERLMPERIDGSATVRDVVMADLNMLAVNEGGRERSRVEMVALLTASGFELTSIVASQQSALSLIEAKGIEPREGGPGI